jgi:hypothetical protein
VSKQGNTAPSAIRAVVADLDSFRGPTPRQNGVFIVALQRIASDSTSG